MAATLLGAIVNRFNDVVFDVAGGIWVDQAPEPISLPLVTFGYDGRRTFETENGYIDEGMVTFTVWAKGLAAAEAYGVEINDTFRENWDQISITGAEVTSMIRDRYLVAPENKRTTDGGMVYRIEMTFEVRVSGIDA